MLYDTYKICLPINENKWDLAFSRKATNIVLGSLKDLKFSFETVHNLAMEKGYKNVDPVFNIENLIIIRKQFLDDWNNDYAERYPNLIFDFHDHLIKNKMFKSYIYRLLKDGSISEFETWKSENREEYDMFLLWKNKNSMQFTDDNTINRHTYE